MDIHEKFHEWAREVVKVEINGIVAHRFEGRGLGIVAERDFKVWTTPIFLSTLRNCCSASFPWVWVTQLLFSEKFSRFSRWFVSHGTY